MLISSCHSNKKASSASRQFAPEINCPEGGNCIFEVLSDSKLEIKKDEFGNLYPEILKGEKLVIKFHFQKNPNPDAVDSSYSEFLYLELDKMEKQLTLKDRDLQKVKMLFGRICFCRDSMGYFKVEKGQLFIFNQNNKLTLNLSFKVDEVPQIITEISEKLSY